MRRELSYFFFHKHHNELIQETDVVSWVETMPNSKETQCTSLRGMFAVQKL